MPLALETTFLGMDPSEHIESIVRQGAAVFDRTGARAGRCHVVVDKPQRQQQRGEHFAVRIYISTPVGDVAVTREGSRPDLPTVIHDAFAAAARDVEAERQRRGRRALKSQRPKHEGRLTLLFPPW